jgi:hypothetical protein
MNDMIPPARPFRDRIDEPSAWTAEELRRDSAWIYELTRSEIAEIEAALKSAKAAGVDLLAVRPETFPLPTLAARLRELTRQLEHGRGIALLRGVPTGRYDVPDIEKIYLGISGYLGVVIAQNSKGDHVGHVRDEGLKWGQVSNGELVRGYRTNAYMPFHSDPTDIVGLLCVQQALEGGLSSIASSMSIYNEILRTHPQALDCLFNGFYYSLRGETGDGLGRTTEYRIPVFDHFAGRLSTRYVRKTIEQGATVGGAPLTAEEREALDLVDLLAQRDDLRFDMVFEPGDIQYLNNYVAFHSRTDFRDGPQKDQQRFLMRLWLQSPDARRLSRPLARPQGERSIFLSREQALLKAGLVQAG